MVWFPRESPNAPPRGVHGRQAPSPRAFGAVPLKLLAPRPLPDPGQAPSPLGPADPPSPLDSPTEPYPQPPAAVTALRLHGVGLSARQLEEAARVRQLPVEVVPDLERADAVLSVRGRLGRYPELRRQAQARSLPILVIKSDSLHQLQRAMERLLDRRQEPSAGPSAQEEGAGQRLDDSHAALEECRLAVEKVVLPQGLPVELLPRNERVRQMQEELISRYRLRSIVFGSGALRRLRVFPA